MNKMQMAHEYALKQMESLSENSTMQSLVSVAWQYADAMQAEAEKREDKTRPESIKNIDPKEYIDAVLQDIVDPCDHEWTHISKFRAEGDFYVCPCGAKSKHARGRK